MHSFGLGVLLIMLSAFGFGLMPIFATYAYAGGVNVPTLLFLRFSLAAACLFVYLFWRRTVWSLGRREMSALLFLGAVLYTMQSAFYFSAVRYIPASLAALVLYLYPVFVAGLAVWLDKETLSLHTALPAVLSLTGIAVVLGAPLDEVDGFGVLLAFGAAIVYSVYITLGRRVVAAVSPLMTSAMISAFAALSFLNHIGDGDVFCRHGTNRRHPRLHPQHGRTGGDYRLFSVAAGREAVLAAGVRRIVGSDRRRLGGVATATTGLKSINQNKKVGERYVQKFGNR